LIYFIFFHKEQIGQLFKNAKAGFQQYSILKRMLVLGSSGMVLIYLAVALYAASFPLHLIQEFDAINYHVTMPRQHLIQGSWAHIPWSVADLYLMPLNYALAPYILASFLPNKMIHFCFLIGLLGCVFLLVKVLSKGCTVRASLAVLAVMASHMIMIQAGTAMMDIIMLYCFIASLHSFLSGRYVLAAFELSFFVWSKAFIAPQFFIIFGMTSILILFAKRNGFIIPESVFWKPEAVKKIVLIFIIGSFVISGPFLLRSYYYTGTPLFPFGLGITTPVAEYEKDHWQKIEEKAKVLIMTKDNYGHGRSLADFIKHFWLLAVPEKGVNNAFDYPVGLVYLLLLGPFLYFFFKGLSQKELSVLSVIIILWWITWWFGSQQSRFLLVPMILMLVVTLAGLFEVSRVLKFLIVLALSIELLSLINAHRADWGKAHEQVLRPNDRELIALKDQASRTVILDFPDTAFSPVAVDVKGVDSDFVISR
jgi:hypothetical protein